MTWIRDESEVDEIIENLVRKNKGKYITQGVSFNKNNSREMALLKSSLMSSTSFSGLIKELITKEFVEEERKVYTASKPKKIIKPNREEIEQPETEIIEEAIEETIEEVIIQSKIKSTGNFF